LFYRWLPNSTNDAITANYPDKNCNVLLWFERSGEFKNKTIIFSYAHPIVDTDFIQRQASLDGGPLFGQATFCKVSEAAVEDIEKKNYKSKQYEAFAKDVVRIIYKTTSSFTNLLRSKYGQYWIAPIEEWDSRSTSLPEYCSFFNFQWSIDGATWGNFYLKGTSIRLNWGSPSERDLLESITKEDWNNIRGQIQGYQHSLEAEWLARSHEYFRLGQIRHAFIEGVTALEISLEKYYKQILSKLPKSEKRLQDLHHRSLQTKIAVLLIDPKFNEITITLALEAIEIRNQIVHEGYEPKASQTLACEHLLRLIGLLIFNDTTKLPKGNGGNRIYPKTEHAP
jgi:hypothetical protein